MFKNIKTIFETYLSPKGSVKLNNDNEVEEVIDAMPPKGIGVNKKWIYLIAIAVSCIVLLSMTFGIFRTKEKAPKEEKQNNITVPVGKHLDRKSVV